MRPSIRRITEDIRRRRNLDAYVAATIALAFAVLSLIGDVVPEDLRWAVLLAGVGLLVYRITLPEHSVTGADDLLRDRSTFGDSSLASRLEGARELWVFAPSAVNFLSTDNCEILRRTVLGNTDGVIRIVVLDPTREDMIELAARQLDDSIDFPVQRLLPSLHTTIDRMTAMAGWSTKGDLEYRYLDYNPGFSLVAIDPTDKDGTVIVEFHAFHNEATSSRMHLELTRRDSQRWYSYWIGQFDHIWSEARPPAPPADT